MPQSDPVAAIAEALRLGLVAELLAEFKEEAGAAHRHYIRFIRAMLRAKAVGDRMAELGADVGTALVPFTNADLVRAAGTAVRGGFLSPDDPVLAGITLGD